MSTQKEVKQEGNFKLKSKTPKKLSVPESTIKMDLAAMKPKEEPVKIDLTEKDQKDALQKQETKESVLPKERSKVELQAVGQGDEKPVENVIKEYDEVNFLLEDNFKYDEDVADEREIKKKKLAFKEEIGKAKNFLTDLKDKYYDEIKLKSNVTEDQKKAMDFFNRYQEDQNAISTQREEFKRVTENTFNDDFEGFDFKLGDKKFRYGVKNPNEIVENQLDITNFVKTFLNKEGVLSDPKGYHKAMYAARNADTIATHFYEQGKADAVKDVVAKSKNITTEARQEGTGNVFVNGLKVKAVSGVDSSKLKIKTRKF